MLNPPNNAEEKIGNDLSQGQIVMGPTKAKERAIGNNVGTLMICVKGISVRHLYLNSMSIPRIYSKEFF